MHVFSVSESEGLPRWDPEQLVRRSSVCVVTSRSRRTVSLHNFWATSLVTQRCRRSWPLTSLTSQRRPFAAVSLTHAAPSAHSATSSWSRESGRFGTWVTRRDCDGATVRLNAREYLLIVCRWCYLEHMANMAQRSYVLVACLGDCVDMFDDPRLAVYTKWFELMNDTFM